MTKTQQKLTTKTNPKWKEKFPCMICGEYHYTKYCPHPDEVT